MTPAAQILLSGALTFGVPLALAVRDLFALRRGSGDGSWPPPPASPPPKPTSLPPTGQRPLPACLIPVRVAPVRERPRIRELA